MANIKKILTPESVVSATKAGWTIGQLNIVAQMCFDETHTGTHGPVEQFSTWEAGVTHIMNHVETINGKLLKGLSPDDIGMILMGNRVIAHDSENAQIVKNPDDGFGLRRYYPEGSTSPFLVEEIYKAIWAEFPEEWKWSPDGTFDYKDLQQEIKDRVFNQLYDLINSIYDYMNK